MDELEKTALALKISRQALALAGLNFERAKEALESTPQFQSYAEAQETLATARNAEAEVKASLADRMLAEREKVGKPNLKFPFGNVVRQTSYEITDREKLLEWIIEKRLPNLVTPVLSEIKKVAETLNPDGFEIKQGFQARINTDLSDFEPIKEKN